MGVSGRDYMRKSAGDDDRIASFEQALREREYGGLAARRRRMLPTAALVALAAFILFLLARAM